MGRPKEISDEQIVAAARRCFLERGATLSAADIARELGVSHTTLFNRFGSKEGLLVAALRPPEHVPWVATMDAGPDDRPIRDQLVEYGREMSAYFQDLQAGLSMLRATGIAQDRAFAGQGEPPPVRSFRAFVGWIRRAQAQGRLAACDAETLASTILGALHGWAWTARACGPTVPTEDHVERLIGLLWAGIGVPGGSSTDGPPDPR
jgi:AcrR family transcriptional regulator